MRLLTLLLLSLLLTGCSAEDDVPKEFALQRLPSPGTSEAPPQLNVHIVDTDTVVTMNAEDYLAGVVAGEMPGDWPLEALKAQAILARTFVLKFITEKESMYSGADISTDIREAQAYNSAAINDRIREAVQETSGEILLCPDGTLPYTWFHSHSGGATSLARDGIDWQGDEPTHTRATAGLDAPDAPVSVRQWQAVFPAKEFLQACRSAGYSVASCERVTISSTDDSGRAVTLLVDDTEVNAARIRISLGSTKMRSTMLTELSSDGDAVTMAGLGYGHGVGMPQWGAYALAQDGFPAEEIALHYYRGLQIVRVW